MQFLVDESVERQIVDRLRQDGYSVEHITRIAPGISDDAVLNMANQRASMLLTADKGFGEMVFLQHRVTLGVVLIRVAGLTLLSKVETIASAIKEHEGELPGAFTVISPSIVRIRRWNGRV